MKRFIYVTGGKGGIGKSFVSSIITDCAVDHGNALLIDTDTINADSSTPYKVHPQEGVAIGYGRIRSEDADGQVDTSGLMDVLTASAECGADTVIVDAPAGETLTLETGGSIIHEVCRQLGATSIIVWIVDSADRTAINALAKAWEGVKGADLLVIVKNNRSGNNFDAFDDNETTKRNLSTMKNVAVIDLPKTAQRLMESWKLDRQTINELTTTAPIGNRVEAQRMRRQFVELFAVLFNKVPKK